jgi:hypothetical protein
LSLKQERGALIVVELYARGFPIKSQKNAPLLRTGGESDVVDVAAIVADTSERNGLKLVRDIRCP